MLQAWAVLTASVDVGVDLCELGNVDGEHERNIAVMC